MPSIIPAMPATCSGRSAASSGSVIISGKMAPLPQPSTQDPEERAQRIGRRCRSSRRRRRRRAGSGAPASTSGSGRRRASPDRADDREDVEREHEVACVALRPAVLRERVGQPRGVAVVDERVWTRTASRTARRVGLRSGNRRSPTGRGPPPCVAASHHVERGRRAARENTSIGTRHESPASASGTESPAAIAAPIWMPLASSR